MSAFALDPLIAEAKQRAWRRRLLALAAAGLIAAGVLAFELAPSGGKSGPSASPSAIRWLPTKPYLGPANPPLAPPCTASQLRGSMGFMGGAGVLFGRMEVSNRSSTACALVGHPKLSFGGRGTAKWGPNPGPPATTLLDPLAPPFGSLRALAPGGHVAVGLFWGPCPNGGAVSGAPESTGTLTAPGGGVIRIPASGNLGCHDYSGSVPSATRFYPSVPQGPPSTALPLRASIVSQLHGKNLDGSTVVAHRGSWLSFTVVLTNGSKHTFRFGRTCPPYKEGIGFSSWTQEQVYVLNCHAVGAIAAGASVRFAMRVHVSPHAPDIAGLGWTLAPHSYNAPEAFAQVEFR